MTKKRIILAILMLLIIATASAHNPDKNDGVRSQKYVYRTSAEKKSAAIDIACSDQPGIFDSIVECAVNAYLDGRKEVEISRTKPREAIEREKQLNNRIKEIQKKIDELTPKDIQEPEKENKMTVLQIEESTKYWMQRQEYAEANFKRIQESNKLINLKNKFMAKYPCVVEKTLEDYLKEAEALMKGPYNANKNKELAEVLKAKSKKRKDAAATTAQQLEDEEKAYIYFRDSIWPEILEYVIPLRDRDYLGELRDNFKKRYGDRYQVFYDALTRVSNMLDNKDYGGLEDILEQIKVKDQ